MDRGTFKLIIQIRVSPSLTTHHIVITMLDNPNHNEQIKLLVKYILHTHYLVKECLLNELLVLSVLILVYNLLNTFIYK